MFDREREIQRDKKGIKSDSEKRYFAKKGCRIISLFHYIISLFIGRVIYEADVKNLESVVKHYCTLSL